jgi:hypothetical protein
VFELQHFDPSVNQNSRAPVDRQLRTQKDGCLQTSTERKCWSNIIAHFDVTMTVPLFLSVATIALTFLFPTSSDKQQASTGGPGSTSSLATTSSMSRGNRAFEFGIGKPQWFFCF